MSDADAVAGTMVLAYHPGLDQTCVVPADAMMHHRLSGWVLFTEWQEAQAQKAAAEDGAAAPSSSKAASAKGVPSASDKDG